VVASTAAQLCASVPAPTVLDAPGTAYVGVCGHEPYSLVPLTAIVRPTTSVQLFTSHVAGTCTADGASVLGGSGGAVVGAGVWSSDC
jgi:hypothetical protein